MKKFKMLLARLCYFVGICAAIYVGGWLMILMPVKDIVEAFHQNRITIGLLLISLLKILLSTTLGGVIWTLGYFGYNYFRGTEDPDWDKLNPKK